MKHISESQLALYAGDDLTGAEREVVAQHISVCGECRKSVERLSAAAGWMKRISPEPSESNLLHVQRRIYEAVERKQHAGKTMGALAAAAVLAIVAFAYLHHVPANAPARQQPAAVSIARSGTVAKQLPQVASKSLPRAPLVRTQRKPKKHGFVRPGVTEMSVVAQNGGPPVIRMKTTDPNVVILWIVSGGSEQEKNDGKGL
jgi:anti-sigma factor RsiW